MGRGKYSPEVKKQVLQLVQEGWSIKDIVEMTGVSSTTIDNWKFNRLQKKTLTGKEHAAIFAENEKNINPLLLNLAKGNDLTPFVGKKITEMQPREIFKFLETLNIKGELIIEQKIKLCQ